MLLQYSVEGVAAIDTRSGDERAFSKENNSLVGLLAKSIF